MKNCRTNVQFCDKNMQSVQIKFSERPKYNRIQYQQTINTRYAINSTLPIVKFVTLGSNRDIYLKISNDKSCCFIDFIAIRNFIYIQPDMRFR